MAITLDLEGNEIQSLLDQAGNLAGRRVLEVGGGDGRLTWRYAARAGQITVVDPNEEKVARALENRPLELSAKVEILPLSLEAFAESYQNAPHHIPYDLILLSWSL